jgi:FecR protein
MSKPSLSGFGRVLLAGAAGVLLALPAFGGSQARIVRLSDVQGSVLIDKNTGMGFESAFLNLPITQGTQLKTRDRARAEIEFEDGSTLRLTPDTTVEFSTLGVSDSGQHISVINLVEGMAYVNWLGKSGDQISLNFSSEKLMLAREAHFRVDTATDVTNLAVFKGEVSVEGPSGTVVVAKKKTATFNAEDNDKSTVADNVSVAPLDSWDKDATEYHQEYVAKNNPSPYGYGASDLGYYGSFSNISGYGMMWQPFFTGAGWDPFMDGAWSWYPGYGYMFVSAYPWGWMPYRYGNWISIPNRGWMWQPGGFNAWAAVPHINGTALAHPLVAPAGSVNTVAVGKGGPVFGRPASSMFPTRMVLNAGSAGLGIPRGSVEGLHQLNREVARGGSVEVHPGPQFAATSGGNSGMMPGFGQLPSAPASSGTMHPSSGGGHVSGGGGGGGVHH